MIPLAIDLFAGTPVATVAFAVKVVDTAGFMVTAFALSLALSQELPLLMLAWPLLVLALSLLMLARPLLVLALSLLMLARSLLALALSLLMLARPLMALALSLLMLALSLLALAHALTEIMAGSRALLLTGIRC